MSELLARDAGERQRRAAHPETSVWVAASAGTGKTKVLTDRVLTLLLAGAGPQRLLCLTFTKAAAAEMANRLHRRLAGWATAAEAPLRAELAALLGRDATEAEEIRARRLFALVLDSPGGIAIETIHAFCQSLLRRFPLEAGVAPHFRVLDDTDSAELLDMVKAELLGHARDGSNPALAEALAVVTARIHETAFPELLAALCAERGRLDRALDRHGGLDGLIAAIAGRLGLAPDDDAPAILARACDDGAFDAQALRAALGPLATGSATDRERGAQMAAWLAEPAGRPAGFAAWRAQFLTQGGEIRKTLATKAVREAAPMALAALEAEAERLLRLEERCRAAETLRATAALLTLGAALLDGYREAKRRRAQMDYDDLILAARRLLDGPGAVPWVLYKLDGGLDHVLIDEAQDTNPDQWAVVGALVAEFFAGEGARAQIRTAFAVGDAKQSIYSFQRADPRAFAEMRARLSHAVPAAGQRWDEVALNLSFRSGEAVLATVNAVFAPGRPARDGVATADEDITHLAFRQGAGGRVELWPPVAPRAREDIAPWKPPVERIRGAAPATRLARLLATRLAAMIGRETLESRGRPLRAGDILVLVRRRSGFVEDLVRELKSRGVAVAGADRMVLTDQIAVMDLLALARVLLLPEDDLTLATVLKGPLIGLSEDQLMTLAHGRGTTGLWETLERRLLDDPAFEAAYDRLAGLRAQADRLSPHALFARVLGPLGGRARLLARLGPEAEDAIDEFVALTLAFERAHPPSLEGFVHWIGTAAPEIKRDLDQSGIDAVRIMTVHGAKGLQAPVVILPDTMQVPRASGRLLWLDDAGDEALPLWPPAADRMDPVCRDAAQARAQAATREYRRLLYVALTRAEDRLIICGWRGRRSPPEGCWYDLVAQALAPLAAEADDPDLAAEGETEGARVLSLSCPQRAPVETWGGPGAAPAAPPLPDWAREPPAAEPSPPRPLSPSRPEEEEPAVRSPLAPEEGPDRWLRGRLIHRLLQTLPDLPAAERGRAMARFLGHPAWGLSRPQGLAIAGEVADILDDPAHGRLWGPDSRAEVPVLGRVGARVISGRIDRLVVGETEVLVVEYKTNRRPPAGPEAVPAAYVRQMAAYRLLLACLYPGRRVRCLLLWTDGPRLIELPAERLDAALPDLDPQRPSQD